MRIGSHDWYQMLFMLALMGVSAFTGLTLVWIGVSDALLGSLHIASYAATRGLALLAGAAVCLLIAFLLSFLLWYHTMVHYRRDDISRQKRYARFDLTSEAGRWSYDLLRYPQPSRWYWWRLADLCDYFAEEHNFPPLPPLKIEE